MADQQADWQKVVDRAADNVIRRSDRVAQRLGADPFGQAPKIPRSLAIDVYAGEIMNPDGSPNVGAISKLVERTASPEERSDLFRAIGRRIAGLGPEEPAKQGVPVFDTNGIRYGEGG